MHLNKIQMKFLSVLQLLVLCLIAGNATAKAANEKSNLAFSEKVMIRIGGYFVDQASTNITILSNTGIGSGISFKDDLNGKDNDTIPRIDAYYRFNDKHRIDFTSFTINRPGVKTLSIDLTIGDETYNANDTLTSEIDYTLYKLGYAYSFYRSDKVELSLLAGLSFTTYDINYSLDTGLKASATDVTAPLPTFGLSMGYAINSNWSVHYKSESFFIEIDNSIKGSLLSYELDIEYKLFKNFAIGAGVSRLSTNAKVNKNNWKGSVEDSHRGILLYGALYF